MSKNWSKEERAAWEKSEVAQELERIVLDTCKRVEILQTKIAGLADQGQGAEDLGDSFDRATESVNNFNNALSQLADDDALPDVENQKKLDQIALLINAFNVLDKESVDQTNEDFISGTGRPEGTPTYLHEELVFGPVSALDAVGIEIRKEPTVKNRIRAVYGEAVARLFSLLGGGEYSNAVAKFSERFPQIDVDYVLKIKDVQLEPSEPVVAPIESEVDDPAAVVAKLRDVLKKASDDGNYLLSYKIERIIDELLEEA
jgi:hypothetical protein